jgi:hypothetical protein
MPGVIIIGMDLFTHTMHDRMKTEAPLAARMRPRTLYGKRTILFVKDVRESLN